jgi:hypothetical protein
MHSCSITVSFLFDHCFCQKVLCHRTHFQGIVEGWNLINDFSEAWNCHKEPKSKASLFDHCLITVPSLSHHWSCVTKHTSKALQKDKIWSMTCLNLAYHIKLHKWKASLLQGIVEGWNLINDFSEAWNCHKEPKSKASLFDHCLITVPSLSHHWSCVTKHTPQALQKDKIWSMTCLNLANHINLLKWKASLLHHRSITVSSLFDHCLITTLPRYC